MLAGVTIVAPGRLTYIDPRLADRGRNNDLSRSHRLPGPAVIGRNCRIGPHALIHGSVEFRRQYDHPGLWGRFPERLDLASGNGRLSCPGAWAELILREVRADGCCTIISHHWRPGASGTAPEIAEYLGITLAAVEIVDFPDGEIGVKLEQNIRGSDVFIIQPTGPPVNRNMSSC